jgi:mono/diheme cytochrome c family protein
MRRFLAPLCAATTLSLSLASCSKAPATDVPAPVTTPLPVPAADTESLDTLRESAREVLDRNCGQCHTSTLPTALPRALAVYDLIQLDWSRRMTPAQLHDAEGRLKEPIAPALGEEEVRTTRVSPEELERFHRYVEGEIARRQGDRAE